MKRAVNELVRDNEIRGLVLFLERPYSGHRKYPLHAQALHAPYVGAKIKFGGKDAVPTAVSRQKRDFAPFQRAQNKDVRSFAERRLYRDLMNVGKTRHGVQTTAANNANLCLLQKEFSCNEFKIN